MTELEEYYNKFNEEKRLNSRHGQVEYRVSMKYIHKYLNEAAKRVGTEQVKVLDIGAGTGRYSVPLAEEGYDVTAVELVKYNLGILKKKASPVKAIQGNAINLKKIPNKSFDVTLLFGPMYHCMNEYSVITYGFKERHILDCMEEGRFNEDFQTISGPSALYDYMRIEQIDALNQAVGLQRIQILSPDGPANYIRSFLNQLSEQEFEAFVRYQMAVCERADLIGAGAHTVDILRNRFSKSEEEQWTLTK